MVTFFATNMNRLQAYIRKMSMKLVWLTTQMGASDLLAGSPTTLIRWKLREKSQARQK